MLVLNSCLVKDWPDISTTFTLMFTEANSLSRTSLYLFAKTDPGVDGMNITVSDGLYLEVLANAFFFFLLISFWETFGCLRFACGVCVNRRAFCTRARAVSTSLET